MEAENVPAAISIGEISISPPVAVAPMVGLSHSALRTLIAELGGAGLYFTEMLSAKRLPDENEHVSPFLIRSSIEHPLFYQIFLSDKKYISPAVEKIESLNAQGIDVNLGCPAPQLTKQGAGIRLAANSANTSGILRELRRKTSLPISAKIRIGDSPDKDKFKIFCQLIEDAGADCLIVHARLTGEKFCRKPRWQFIREAKKILSIPVIANGGISTKEQAKKCIEITGADGLMIGRASVSRPWLLAEISSHVYGVGRDKIYPDSESVFFRFADLLVCRFREERRLGRLKQFTHYYAQEFQFGHHLAKTIQTSSTMEQAVERARLFFNTHRVTFEEEEQ